MYHSESALEVLAETSVLGDYDLPIRCTISIKMQFGAPALDPTTSTREGKEHNNARSCFTEEVEV